MELAKELVLTLRDLAWPATVLALALWFRAPILAVLGHLANARNRSVRLKMGNFEVESQLAEKAEELLQQVANEPDMDKRLKMIKEPFLLEAAIREITRPEADVLMKLHSGRLTNAFHVNWHNPHLDGLDTGVCNQLEKLGLIAMSAMYDGDEIGRITPAGLALVERLSLCSEPNKPLNADEQQASLPRAG